MDYDYPSRLQKRLEEAYETKFNALFAVPKNDGYAVTVAETVGFLRAIKAFGEMIKQEMAPQKQKEGEKNEFLA